ncbi:hypothetical protein SUGI_0241600 [Cryptomeria japonica]|uniref:uncharacterized protein LOC131068522 isoform X2 n=1 Tax=Cryptomeria japonica TaxID=3369 RepID=UPI00240894B1|nr:uncharacterized protein LOC131068522 isoform X2 [Cryptomeria japonica]GLJ14852.1 hypothetical protein SUGI_0241600 [Cryptomeria japonica]
MAGVDAAKIAIELQVLIFDRLQVVSYKWLSRNFSVPSNSAKRLLQEFVEQNGDGLEVIYAISGWSKTEPGCYSVRLVKKSKLEEVKAEFKDHYSVHIYSVQSCLPKDPAELWGAEFVQAEGLFNQPSSVNNCFWDNRFSAVSYPLVKRNLNGKSTRIGPPISQPQLASAPVVVNGLPKQSVSLPQVHVPSTTEKSVETVPKAAPQSSVSAIDVKEVSAGKSVNAPTAATNKKKGQNGKNSEGTLASLWGRASSKPKPTSSPAPTNHDVQINASEDAGNASNASSKPKSSSLPPPNHGAEINASEDAGNGSKASSKPKPSSTPPSTNHVNADAQINAWEDAGNASDEDEEDFFSTRRVQSTNGSGRKRRFVFDMSDDENEDDVIVSKPAASLASPELPKQTSNAKEEAKTSHNKDAAQENKDVKAQGKEKTKATSARKSTVSGKSTKGVQSRKTHDQMEGKVDHSAHNNTKPGSGMEEKNICPETKTCKSECIPSDDAPASNAGVKKRKVLKTHIDGRGREVTEVTWEVDGVEEEKAKDVPITVNSSVPRNADNKPKETGKVTSVDPSHSANPTTKPSSKHTQKGAGKDTRQGNILSFFKKS